MKSGKSKNIYSFLCYFSLWLRLRPRERLRIDAYRKNRFLRSFRRTCGLRYSFVFVRDCVRLQKKDKLALDEISVGLMVDVLLLFMTVCSPIIFVVWIIEKIHDAVSANRYKNV